MKVEAKGKPDWAGDFLRYLSAERGYSPRTLESYGAALRVFEAWFHNLDEELTWQTVDSDVVRNWTVSLMRSGLAPRSVQLKLSALRSFYRYLLRTGRVDKDPAHVVKSPKADKPLPAFVRQREMEHLFRDVDFGSDFAGVRDRLILLTFYCTGIRLAELVGLNTPDVDLSSAELRVTGKRNKQRIVPFGLELEEAIQHYLTVRTARFGGQPTPFFVDDQGGRIGRTYVQRTVKKYLSMVTLQKKRSPHVLRHTFATVMLNNGADLEAVKEILGHESLATTEIYTHTTFAELKKEYEHAHPRA